MRLTVLLKLAMRSVGRNTRRSALTSLAMVLGLALLVFSRSLAEGAYDKMIDSGVRMGSGHIAIQAPEYLETGKLEHRLEAGVVRLASEVANDVLRESLLSWAPRLSVNGLASSTAAAVPVRIEGVDPELERAFSDIEDKLQDGRYLEAGDRLHAYIGTELAQRLDVQVGNRFVLTAQTSTGDVEGQLVRVAGIFQTGIPEVDQSLIHIPIDTAREWLHTPGATSTLAFLLNESELTDIGIETLQQELKNESQIRVLGWRESSPELAAAIRLDSTGNYIFHSILLAIIALAILNAVMISVLGRRREFGVLQAMGLTGVETGFVVFLEGLFLTVISGVAGISAGLLFTWGFFRDGLDFSIFMEDGIEFGGQFMEPIIIPHFSVEQLLISTFVVVTIGMISSLYPALRASKLDVAEAMKFEQ